MIQFIIEQTCVQNVHAQDNYAANSQQRLLIKSMQYKFNSCSFNYKSDYNRIFFKGKESEYKCIIIGTWKIILLL